MSRAPAAQTTPRRPPRPARAAARRAGEITEEIVLAHEGLVAARGHRVAMHGTPDGAPLDARGDHALGVESGEVLANGHRRDAERLLPQRIRGHGAMHLDRRQDLLTRVAIGLVHLH